MREQSNKIFIRKLLSSRIFLFFIMLALIWLALGAGRETYRKYQLTKEIKDLKAQIAKLDGGNQQLNNLIEYFQDESYLEKEARLKLNLTRPGEKVVIVPENSLTQEVSLDENQSAGSQNENPKERITGLNPALIKTEQIETSNWWKWWEYFFQR